MSAGLGTRLHPLTLVRAKPAIPVAGEPMIRRIIRGLVASGVNRLTLNLHHLPHTVTRVVGDGSDLGAQVRYSWEQPLVLGTAGGPRNALDIIGAEHFFVVNGDTLTDVSLDDLARAHESTASLVTLALVPNTAPLRYGGLHVSSDGAVTGVAPRGASAVGSFHFLGVQAVAREAFAGAAAGQPMNSIGGLYDTLMKNRPGSVRGFVTQASFWDVGTIADYWTTSIAFAERDDVRPPAATPSIPSSATVTGSILRDDVKIGERATLDECIVTDHVRVPPGARYRRVVLTQPSADEPPIATPFAIE